MKLAPSVFVRARVEKEGAQTEGQGFFRCPSCHGTDLVEIEETLICRGCGREWAIDDGIYDFKQATLSSLA